MRRALPCLLCLLAPVLAGCVEIDEHWTFDAKGGGMYALKVAWDGDRPVKTQVMRLSLTWDHRVLDGGPAALFLAEVKALLEAPYRLLL